MLRALLTLILVAYESSPANAGHCSHSSPMKYQSCSLGAKAPEVELYVTGLNHAYETRDHVSRAGVDELVDIIAQTVIDPANLIVALSGASTAGDCKAGGWHSREGRTYNSECLAFALQNRFPKHRFDLKDWYHDDEHWDGRAIISGERWAPILSDDFPAPHGTEPQCNKDDSRVLRVTFEDAKKPRHYFTVFVAHTDNAACGIPAQATMVRAAAATQPPNGWPYAGQVAPLFVGDFNGSAADMNQYWTDHFNWIDGPITCPAVNKTPALGLGLGNDVIHVFGARDFACAAEHFVPVRASYSIDASGQPSCSGLKVRDIDHNIIALGLAIEGGGGCNANSTCREQRCVACPQGTTACNDGCFDLRRDRKHCGSCSATPCANGERCTNGSCTAAAPTQEHHCSASQKWCETVNRCVSVHAPCPD